MLAFVELMAQFCRYKFRDEDSDAIVYGVRETIYENNCWFEYPLIGNSRIGFRLSREVGTSVIFFEINTLREIEEKIEINLYVLNHLRGRVGRQQYQLSTMSNKSV